MYWLSLNDNLKFNPDFMSHTTHLFSILTDFSKFSMDDE